MIRILISTVLCLAVLLPAAGFATETAADEAALREAAAGLASSRRSEILTSLDRLQELDDPRILPALEALVDKRLRGGAEGRLYAVDLADSDRLLDAISGQPVDADVSTLTAPRINNRVRSRVKNVQAQMKLRSPDVALRLHAAQELRSRPSSSAESAIQSALDSETDGAVQTALLAALAQIQLAGEDRDKRLSAIVLIGDSGDRELLAQLEPLLAVDADGAPLETDEELRAAALAASAKIDRTLFFIDALRNLFYGLSLASILLLAALGLAITFGLMGVINMAHGEMLMIGAYSTYVVLGLFQHHLPSAVDLYLIAAVPVAFLVTAAIGMALERSVIRFLYGRPLETLLATWGISLILIQLVRSVFGAQNVEVSNPSWLSGGYEIVRGVVLPWSRLAIVAFAAGLVAAVAAVLQRTRLGLWVRAVTQNREMAAGLGIPTARVDMLTFGLGSGIAGLGGVALSQIGNVGPELGQSYIVDSFMVVVLGGVGKLIGAVVAALGLGVLNKFLEPVSGAVLGKIFVLGFLILFIQWRPQGIFALRGRAAEA